jgi:hypothetical protein
MAPFSEFSSKINKDEKMNRKIRLWMMMCFSDKEALKVIYSYSSSSSRAALPW